MAEAYRILILGGTSAIAVAFAERRVKTLVKEGISPEIVLAGRDESKMKGEVANLNVLGASAQCVVTDLAKVDQKLLDKAGKPFDEVLLAYGVLTDQARAQNDQAYRDEQLRTNFVSASEWIELVLAQFEANGKGRLIVIGSVAGDRGRQSNYAYGASKAALASWVQGAQHRFAGNKDISITLIKPGFVDTPMTAHIEKKGALWASPEQIAKTMETASQKRKRVVYAPFFWWPIMVAIRNTPAVIFEKTKL